jgi:hypothetical protein
MRSSELTADQSSKNSASSFSYTSMPSAPAIREQGGLLTLLGRLAGAPRSHACMEVPGARPAACVPGGWGHCWWPGPSNEHGMGMWRAGLGARANAAGCAAKLKEGKRAQAALQAV